MRCPHCLVEFVSEVRWIDLGEDKDGHWAIEKYECPNPKCGKYVIYLVNGESPLPIGIWGFRGFDSVKKRIMVHPKGSSRPPVPTDVPPMFANDYTEACLTLSDSPTASAALSRRCLQNLLREKANVKYGNLADEIEEVISSGTLPSYLVEIIDAVRNVGNFAAHPLKSQKTGEILPVEPTEAEWNLSVLEALFDFYFVLPEIVKEKRAALDKKLKEAGKKPMK